MNSSCVSFPSRTRYMPPRPVLTFDIKVIITYQIFAPLPGGHRLYVKQTVHAVGVLDGQIVNSARIYLADELRPQNPVTRRLEWPHRIPPIHRFRFTGGRSTYRTALNKATSTLGNRAIIDLL